MDLPHLEITPREELEWRIRRFQLKLQEAEVEGALITHDTGLFYLTGTVQRAQLYVPADGDPIMMVQKYFPRARVECLLDHVVAVPSRKEIPSIIRDFGYHPKVLGLELDVIPAEHYLHYQKLFPQSKITDVALLLRQVRAIKSNYEINLMQRAARVVYNMFSECPDIIKAGLTEIHLSGTLEATCRKFGHHGKVRVRGYNQYILPCHILSGSSGAIPSGFEVVTGGESTSPAIATGGGFKTVAKKEPIYIDCAAGVNGYLADITRTFCLEDLPNHLKNAYQLAVAIEEKVAALMRPGISCAEVYALALDEVRGGPYAGNFMGGPGLQLRFIGHGLGLELNEWPVLAPGFDTPLEAGMVLAIEPTFVFPEGAIGIEDDYVITSHGCTALEPYSKELIKI